MYAPPEQRNNSSAVVGGVLGTLTVVLIIAVTITVTVLFMLSWRVSLIEEVRLVLCYAIIARHSSIVSGAHSLYCTFTSMMITISSYRFLSVEGTLMYHSFMYEYGLHEVWTLIMYMPSSFIALRKERWRRLLTLQHLPVKISLWLREKRNTLYTAVMFLLEGSVLNELR
jgi:hypothetical protein